jgi:hypothetical protein
MKLKSIGIVIGALLAMTGLIVGAGGVAVLGTIGTDGKVATGDQSFDTSGAALVTSAADLRRPTEVSDIVGDPRIQLSVQSDKPAFVGVARAADVDRYLKNASVDEVTDFEVDPFTMKHNPRAGFKQLAPPAKQSFWIASSSGTHPSLDWKAGSDEYRMVVMNADGSRGVQTHGDASVTIPHTAAIAWSLVGGGLLLLLAGAATIASARASDPSPRRTPAYTPAA